MSKVKPAPADKLSRHPDLYRARLSCKIGRDAIEYPGKTPLGATGLEWAVFNLLHAVEDIAGALMRMEEERKP